MAGFDKSIRLKIVADVREYQEAVAKLPGVTQKQAAAAGLRMERELVRAQRNAAKEGNKAAKSAGAGWIASAQTMAAAFAAVGVGRLVGQFGDLQQGINDARNALLDASARTGVSAELWNGLQMAAEGAGLQMSDMEGALKRFPRSMRDAASGVGTAKGAFEALGIEVTNADGSLRDADTVLQESLTAIQGLSSETEQAALAMEIFGGRGATLLQALGGAELSQFAAIANKYGTQVGPEAAASSAAWQREVAGLQNVLRGATETLFDFGMDGADAIGVLQIAIVTMTELVTETAGAIGSFFGEMGSGYSALLRGDVGEAIDHFAKSSAVQLIDSLSTAKDRAFAAGQEYADYADMIRRTAVAHEGAADAALIYADAVKTTTAAVDESTVAAQEIYDQLREVQELVREAAAEDTELFDLDAEVERMEILRLELRALGEDTAEVDQRINQLMQDRRDIEAERSAEVWANIQREREARIAAEQAMAQATRDAQQERLDSIISTAEAGSTVLTAAFEGTKTAAIAEATISTAAGVARALKDYKYPVSLAIGTLVAGAGAIEIAKIASTQGPSYHTGLSSPPAPDEVSATLTRRERVLTSAGVRAAGGDAAVRDLNRGTAAGGVLVVNQVYKHRVLDRSLQDNIRRDAPLRRGVRALVESGGTSGHRRTP